MSNLDRIRVGIVGCGYQGGILAKAVAKTQSFQFIACSDPDLAAAHKVVSASGDSNVYASVEEMLDKNTLDVIFVATPHHLLCPVTLMAIRAGKHVLVEKPIGLIEAEAIQIEKAAAKAGVCCEAGYSFRYLPAWQRVYELLQTGAVGEIQAVSGVFSLPPMQTGWKATPETGGGPLLFLGSHLIDQILWYISDAPVSVYASVTHRNDTKAEETAVFQMRFANGAIAQCISSQASPSLLYGLNIHGRDGRISLNPVGFLEQEIVVSSTRLPEFKEPTTIRLPLTDDIRMVKHVAQLEAFAAAIRERCQPPITVSDGRQVLKVIDAVFKSGQTGQPVHLA